MALALFDPITLNWYNADNTELSTESPTGKVFKKGFNDPTYRTFRIEFGDWGASITDNVIDAFATRNDLMLMDYDKYPAGLLDTNYLHSNNKNNNKYSQTYSAYRYLKNRNEDTRAEYLRQFIEGIYEIQRKYPYIFQDISGIDTLSQFDNQRGQRIDKAEISITCYEGLSLKMQTLMELYRKAAWDDIYQRWILPLNMREFKMIIYIFERRVFHKLSENGIFSVADFEADLPVYAFECEPCEFVIENHFKQQYSQQYLKNSDFENTTIKIQVKNVKTYYTNGLMRSGSGSMTKKLLIYDLMHKVERQQTRSNEIFAYINENGYTSSLATENSLHAIYLNRIMLMRNEFNDPMTSAQRQAGGIEFTEKTTDNNDVAVVTANLSSLNKELHPFNEIIQPEINYEWHAATVTAPDYWSSSIKGDVRNLFKADTWQEIGHKMLNVIVSGTTQIRVAPMYGQLLTSIFKNVLPGIEYSPSAMYISYATTGPVGPMKHIDNISYITHKTLNNLDTKKNPHQKLKDEAIEDPYNKKYLKEYSKYNKTIGVFKHKLTQKDDYSVDPMDKMNVLEDYKTMPMDKMNVLDEYKTTPMDKLNVIDEKVNSLTPTFDNIEDTDRITQDINLSIDDARKQPDLYNDNIDDSLHISTYYKKQIDKERTQPDMSKVDILGDSGLTIDKDKVNVATIEGLHDGITEITTSIDGPSEPMNIDMSNIDSEQETNIVDFNHIDPTDKTKQVDFNNIDSEQSGKKIPLNEINQQTNKNDLGFNEITETQQHEPLDLHNVEETKRNKPLDFNTITSDNKHNIVDFNNIETTIDNDEKPKLENIEQFKRNVAINKLKTLENVARPPRSELIQQLIEFDKEATKNEKIIQNTIIDGEIETANTESVQLLKIFAENREGFQESFANRVIALKNTLIDKTKNLVKDIPDQQIETSRERKTVGMATIEETEQIKSNAILTGLADEDIRKMSLATLIALNDQFVESLDHTVGMKPTKIETPEKRDKRLIGGHIIEDPLKK